jgi:hypothetical protein
MNQVAKQEIQWLVEKAKAVGIVVANSAEEACQYLSTTHIVTKEFGNHSSQSIENYVRPQVRVRDAAFGQVELVLWQALAFQDREMWLQLNYGFRRENGHYLDPLVVTCTPQRALYILRQIDAIVTNY